MSIRESLAFPVSDSFLCPFALFLINTSPFHHGFHTSSPRSNASNLHLLSNCLQFSFSQEYMDFKCVYDGRVHVYPPKKISDIRWERAFREEGVLSSTSKIILCGRAFSANRWGQPRFELYTMHWGNQAISSCINSFICI